MKIDAKTSLSTDSVISLTEVRMHRLRGEISQLAHRISAGEYALLVLYREKIEKVVEIFRIEPEHRWKERFCWDTLSEIAIFRHVTQEAGKAQRHWCKGILDECFHLIGLIDHEVASAGCNRKERR